MGTLTRADAEDFLFYEARLLDERRFAEWLGLFTADCHYWIPCGQGEDPGVVTHLVYDDRSQLEDRVWQLQQPRHSSQSPPSLTTHLISNVQVDNSEEARATLRSNFVLYELRRMQGGEGEPRSFAGFTEHFLRLDGTDWKIEMKKVWLLNRDLPVFNLTFLL
jgi:3-phenylpropionate/cinnamic acid dioxygenase small subunit